MVIALDGAHKLLDVLHISMVFKTIHAKDGMVKSMEMENLVMLVTWPKT